MTLSGRPLLDTRADAELFVDREPELAQLFSSIEHRFNCLVAGEAGVGKTSLLRMLMYRIRNAQDVPGPVGDNEVFYVRAECITSGEELLGRIATEVIANFNPRTAAGVPATLELLEQRRQHRLDQVQERWRSQGSDADAGQQFTSVIIVDDVTASAGHALFGRLRDELWGLGYVWVAAARPSERGGLLLPPADAFFDRLIELGPLSGGSAEELVTKRTGSHPGSWPAQVAQAVGGNPRRILSVARDMIDRQGGFNEILGAISRRDAAIHALGRPESMLADELEALGAAAASDQALLSRLGWTRGRAVQVLTRLEQAGLVSSDEVRAGPGRPRKVFRLTPP